MDGSLIGSWVGLLAGKVSLRITQSSKLLLTLRLWCVNNKWLSLQIRLCDTDECLVKHFEWTKRLHLNCGPYVVIPSALV